MQPDTDHSRLHCRKRLFQKMREQRHTWQTCKEELPSTIHGCHHFVSFHRMNWLALRPASKKPANKEDHSKSGVAPGTKCTINIALTKKLLGARKHVCAGWPTKACHCQHTQPFSETLSFRPRPHTSRLQGLRPKTKNTEASDHCDAGNGYNICVDHCHLRTVCFKTAFERHGGSGEIFHTASLFGITRAYQTAST